MTNPRLNKEQLLRAQRLLTRIRKAIAKLANGNEEMVFAFRRKIFKELTYDERSKPIVRTRLKRLMLKKQKGLCAVCRRKLPKQGAVLDRLYAPSGYTEANVRLIHPTCDVAVQRKRRYK